MGDSYILLSLYLINTGERTRYMGLVDGVYWNKGLKCNIQDDDWVTFEEVENRVFRLKMAHGYATYVSHDEPVAYTERIEEKNDKS